MTAVPQEPYLRARLFALREERYRDFQAGLMPTVPKERILGIRTPHLRRLAKELAGGAEARDFLAALPHAYYEEDNLHAFLICEEREFSRALALTEAFLPHIDNWATCDSFSPPAFGRHREELLPHATRWMASDAPYIIRYGIGMHMRHYLGDDFRPDMPARIAAIRHGHYYVRMMVAWYFATALVRQPQAALEVLREGRLDAWTHNKAIQKARESRCVSAEMKEMLNTWKR
ncbi:MAG: DNA alkylation repair protein [Clostridia bacterium]|nr:DNA alkylation repair protein [Clostridia bacterium]